MRASTRKFWQQHRWLVAVLLLVATLGCGELPGKPNPADKPVLPDQVPEFEKLFANNCAGCHGSEGHLGPAPPLNDPLFVEIISPEQLTGVVESGRAGTPMPPFSKAHGGPLTDQQVGVLVDGIRSHWKAAKPTKSLPPTYATNERDGVLAGNRERGAELFKRACSGCHGANGLGVVEDGVATNVINTSAFLSLISDQAIRRIIITGRPDLGMPSFSQRAGRPDDFQPLTSADVDDLVALLADWRASSVTASTSTP